MPVTISSATSYPYVPFILEVGTWTWEGEAYPDSGFEGGLCIPRVLSREVLADPDECPYVLADGTVRIVRVWAGEIEVEGRRFDTDVIGMGSRFLLGRQVLDELEICFKFGKRVQLRFSDERADP